MEQRKVQQVGGGTYTVSLPKRWAERTGITAGKTVHIDVHGDEQLVIEPESPADDATSRVQLTVGDEPPNRLERTVKAAYAAGFEELVLQAPEGFSSAQRQAVEQVASGFVGVALTTETETELIVRALLDATEVSVRQSVRQLRFTALSMHRDAMAALVDDEAPPAADREDEADRLYAMIDRHFGRGLSRLDEVDALGLSRSELFELRTAARELERVADNAETIGAVAAAVDTLPDALPADKLRVIGRDALSVVERGTAVVVGDGDTDVANDALETREATRSAVEALDRELADPAGDYRLGRALDALRRTVESGGTIAELGLRAATRRGEFTPPESAAPAGDGEGDR
ncbi:phosphate signaling complex PhoU family protein [Halorientalis marina]|jgi:phosphate uptake regulator|uniref:phosphate signaling complex PhoU family protein n=1 Tax=Halorientalis marina TaxID=2931976 RepID=UPI001FF0EE46|nr:phosphate uptake regulator PhoU [Halorientalis marina]